MRHREIEHRVAQEFEPLVVVGAKAAVGGGLQQKASITKGVTQAGLQCGKRVGGAHGGQSNEPMRLRLPKFIQTKKALPTMFLSGTKPQ